MRPLHSGQSSLHGLRDSREIKRYLLAKSIKGVGKMRVLLLKDVKGLGHTGDIKEVAGGYAANYLFPNRLARPVTEGTIRAAEQIKEAAARKQERKITESQALATRLTGQTIIFKARSGEGDRLYGSITSADIAEALARATGLDIDRKIVSLDHPIKSLGQHQVPLKLGGGLTATITAIVERDKAAE